jgi:hypothetical protein
MQEEMWTFGEIAPEGDEDTDLKGFTVTAGDDEVGRVVDATFEPGASCVVVETGVRLVGRRVLVPASFFTTVDVQHESIEVSLTKEQVEEAPALDADVGDLTVQQDRDEVQAYFEGLGGSAAT